MYSLMGHHQLRREHRPNVARQEIAESCAPGPPCTGSQQSDGAPFGEHSKIDPKEPHHTVI